MVTIDCANDNELAEELGRYLKTIHLESEVADSLVMVAGLDVDKILNTFLRETNRSAYSIRKVDDDTVLLAKEIPIEDFGFLRCEMCGYVVSSEVELLTHRRAHGIQLL